MRGVEQPVRPAGGGQSVRDPHAFRGPPGRVAAFDDAAGLHDDDRRVRRRAKDDPLPPGKAVGNSTEDRACRTKLCGEPVGDIEKLFTEWDAWGWHRVTVYGDLKEPVFALADALGWKVLEEA